MYKQIEVQPVDANLCNFTKQTRNNWCLQQAGQISTPCWMKEATLKRMNAVWFHVGQLLDQAKQTNCDREKMSGNEGCQSTAKEPRALWEGRTCSAPSSWWWLHTVHIAKLVKLYSACGCILLGTNCFSGRLGSHERDWSIFEGRIVGAICSLFSLCDVLPFQSFLLFQKCPPGCHLLRTVWCCKIISANLLTVLLLKDGNQFLPPPECGRPDLVTRF